VQIVYERNVRPPEKLHQPWVDRVTGQLLAACGALDADVRRTPLAVTSQTIDQVGVTTAVVWRFIDAELPEIAKAADHPALHSHSLAAEQLREFAAAPHGDSTYVDRD
jgi:hypothetical protein